MIPTSADIVICGAGIAGIAAAYHLAARHGIGDVLLVEERSPLMMTSDKSTEAYRNWWPGPGDAMVRFMNRSIDLLEELADLSGNAFHLNRRGYAFLTADPAKAEVYRRSAEESERLGAGQLRIHRGRPDDPPFPPHSAEGYAPALGGADLVLDPALIRQRFPFVAEDAIALLHPRRCGWLSAQQLGMWLLDEAKQRGVRLVNGRVTAVDTNGGRVNSVTIRAGGREQRVATRVFVNAAGPLVDVVGEMLGVPLPVFNELHGKVAINDPLGVVPRDAPLMIWSDPVTLPWSDEEREALAEDPESAWMLGQLPVGVHCRPEGHTGGSVLLILWNFHLDPVEPTFPIAVEDEYPELALRGMSAMVPGLARYFDRAPKPYIDGGYYTKTPENRPLIGPLPVAGAYVVGALSGYGLMAACAAGELLAAYIAGAPLPSYAPALALARYGDPAYQQQLAQWGDSGQL